MRSIYVGFVVEQGCYFPVFVSDKRDMAITEAKRHVDDALPNNTVQVFKCFVDTQDGRPVFQAFWTPEGEDVKFFDG